MLDDFLNDDEEITTFLDELEDEDLETDTSRPHTGFMGMTPFQRFVVSLLFFLMVVVAGSFCLLVTGSVRPPF